MYPNLLQFLGINFPAFFPLIMVGILCATFYGVRIARREHADPVVLLDFGMMGMIGGILGARIFHILFEYQWHWYYLEDPKRVFYFWQGGFASLGAFILVPTLFIIYLKRRKLMVWRYIDIATILTPIIDFFTRLACLLVGCCYGKKTDFPLHLIFTHPSSTPVASGLGGEALHATQVYFMLNAVIAFALVHWIYRKRTFYGNVCAAFLLYYGVTRFLIEFLRGDDDRGLWFGGALSSGQVVMLGFIASGLLLWWQLKKRYPIIK